LKYYLKNEIHRAIISKNAVIAFAITLFSLMIAFLEFVHFPTYGIKSSKLLFDAVDIFIRIRYSTRASTLVIIAPLLATLAFSDSYLLDKESGFLRFIYMRLPQKKYVWIRLLVNSIASGFVISLASLVMFIFLISFYGIRSTDILNISGPFSWIFYKSRFWYSIFIIIISFIFNVIFSTLALGISPWIKNRYLTLISPFFYYIISGTVFQMLKINKYFNLNGTILFTLNPITTQQHIIIYQCLLFLIGIGLFYFGVIYKDEKNI